MIPSLVSFAFGLYTPYGVYCEKYHLLGDNIQRGKFLLGMIYCILIRIKQGMYGQIQSSKGLYLTVLLAGVAFLPPSNSVPLTGPGTERVTGPWKRLSKCHKIYMSIFSDEKIYPKEVLETTNTKPAVQAAGADPSR